MTERKPNLHLKPESEVDGKKQLTRKKNLGQKLDLSIFCNKTQLRQNREVTSISMSRHPNSNNPVRSLEHLRKLNQQVSFYIQMLSLTYKELPVRGAFQNFLFTF